VAIKTAVDHLRLLSETGYDISAELEFVFSHFRHVSGRTDALRGLPVSLIYAILCHRPLPLENEDNLYEFNGKGGEFFALMEFITSESRGINIILWQSSGRAIRNLSLFYSISPL
jgi:hypothetical protein